MSFSQLSIVVAAQNLASAVFAQVAADAGAMASQVAGQSVSVYAQNYASPTFNQVAQDAAQVRSEVEVPMAMSFAPVEMPSVSGFDVSGLQAAQGVFSEVSASAMEMSVNVRDAGAAFGQLSSDAGGMAGQVSGYSNSVSVLGSEFAQTGVDAQGMGQSVDVSSQSLSQLGNEAEGTTVKLSTVARGISSVSSLGLGLTTLAGDFGLVDAQSTKWMRTGLAMVTVVAETARLINSLTAATTGHTVAVALGAATDSAGTSASLASTVAMNIKSAATWVATAAQTALDISYGTFLALTGVGIAVIIAAAGAMAYFASQMNAATSSVQNFNNVSVDTPSRVRSIQRSGDSAMYRSGLEASP